MFCLQAKQLFINKQNHKANTDRLNYNFNFEFQLSNLNQLIFKLILSEFVNLIFFPLLQSQQGTIIFTIKSQTYQINSLFVLFITQSFKLSASRLNVIASQMDSVIKPITDEQFNQCMEFCTMYNVLYAMHQFPIPLRNIRSKKTIKNSKLQQPSNLKLSPSEKQPSRTENSKPQTKKTSKFQKPKTKKLPNPQATTPSSYQNSEVDNYPYQSEGVEYIDFRNLTEKSKKTKPINSQYIGRPTDESPPKQIDLAALISGLAVGSSFDRNERKKNSLYDQSNPRDLTKNRDQEDPQIKSRLYHQDYPQTSRGQAYPNYDTPHTAWNYNTKQSKFTNLSPYQSNPYSKNNNNTYRSDPFMETYSSQYPPSPYANQLRAFSNINSYDTPQNISKNLFIHALDHRPPNPKPFDPFNYESNSNQNPLAISHFANNPSIRPPQSKLYENPFGVSHPKSAKRDYEDDTTGFTPSPYSQSYVNHVQQPYTVGNTPPKTLKPSDTQRTLSPLGNSASCRSFFVQTQKQMSADRSGASRSKSRRKQRPGGSKSFYQPSLSGRKVVSKQKPQEQREYQQYSQQRDHSERDVQTYTRPSQFNFYNRNAEEDVRDNKKRTIAPTQYPRNTGQTDYSGVSGWQQGNQPQKSTKSQQVINSKNLDIKKTKTPAYQKQKNKDSPRLGHELQKHSHQLLQQYDQNQYNEDNDIDLEDLQEDMQRLNTSRRKVPKPITEVDLTNPTNPKVKLKR